MIFIIQNQITYMHPRQQQIDIIIIQLSQNAGYNSVSVDKIQFSVFCAVFPLVFDSSITQPRNTNINPPTQTKLASNKNHSIHPTMALNTAFLRAASRKSACILISAPFDLVE